MEGDGYHSHYRAEVYDLAHDDIDWMNEDADVFWMGYKKMRASRALDKTVGNADRYRLLDIGCGTGRVFRQLAANLKKGWVSPDGTQFLGLDLSPHMLARAQAILPEALKAHTRYILGSALELQSIEALQQQAPGLQIDMLTFAAGSISMLYDPEDGAERFLEQVAAILRPETGRAYISIRYVFDDSRPEMADAVAMRFAEMERSSDIPSQIYPGIIYRHVEEGAGQRREGNLVFWDLPMEVVERNAKGHEKVLERDIASMGGRVWQEGELVSAATAAGLVLVEEIPTSNETMYVFKVAARR
ncbi:hypothetical protein F1880_009671 [Penicillium rolfsii]|nr:hypothetical protein F1880_009671 [Penicillium rolfsii]